MRPPRIQRVARVTLTCLDSRVSIQLCHYCPGPPSSPTAAWGQLLLNREYDLEPFVCFFTITILLPLPPKGLTEGRSLVAHTTSPRVKPPGKGSCGFAPPLRSAETDAVGLRPAPCLARATGSRHSAAHSAKTRLTDPLSLLSQNIRTLQASSSHQTPNTEQRTAHSAQRTPRTPFPPHNSILHQTPVTAATDHICSGNARPGDSMWRWHTAHQIRPGTLHSRPFRHPQITQPTTRCQTTALSIATTTTCTTARQAGSSMGRPEGQWQSRAHQAMAKGAPAEARPRVSGM